MKMKDIKVNHWYETTQGIGLTETVGGTRPPSVMVRIVTPIPRGKVNLAAKDILREVPAPSCPTMHPAGSQVTPTSMPLG